ncbi:hypothetical protein TESG_08576 [Trichophyton tonsurans CBS 112818]|uniref:Uncharacterized protein n=2 Tax=Trichophyton TaxID=5550 RepID=F2PZ77_TRIEC|nr:hypothetical protein TESG_08576 [Trichophyton tonsurans CBS 112818]EGE07195.1 hypothetical protein TEQG_06267 [Trichophyton equinum CBS 127.97]
MGIRLGDELRATKERVCPFFLASALSDGAKGKRGDAGGRQTARKTDERRRCEGGAFWGCAETAETTLNETLSKQRSRMKKDEDEEDEEKSKLRKRKKKIREEEKKRLENAANGRTEGGVL